LHLETRQRFDIGFDDEDDVSASTAITPVGTAPRDVFLAPEGNGASPTVTRTDGDFRLIGKQ
jgi:hypothetical protein